MRAEVTLLRAALFRSKLDLITFLLLTLKAALSSLFKDQHVRIVKWKVLPVDLPSSRRPSFQPDIPLGWHCHPTRPM